MCLFFLVWQNHWNVAFVDFREKGILFGDSMLKERQGSYLSKDIAEGIACRRLFFKFLQQEARIRGCEAMVKKDEWDISGLELDVPQQSHGSLDCGVFMCGMVDAYEEEREFDVTPAVVEAYRHYMAYVLYNQRLPDTAAA